MMCWILSPLAPAKKNTSTLLLSRMMIGKMRTALMQCWPKSKRLQKVLRPHNILQKREGLLGAGLCCRRGTVCFPFFSESRAYFAHVAPGRKGSEIVASPNVFPTSIGGSSLQVSEKQAEENFSKSSLKIIYVMYSDPCRARAAE